MSKNPLRDILKVNCENIAIVLLFHHLCFSISPPPLFHCCVLGWLSAIYCPLQCGYALNHLITNYFLQGWSAIFVKVITVAFKQPVWPLSSPRPPWHCPRLWRHSPEPPVALMAHLPKSLWFRARWKEKKERRGKRRGRMWEEEN